MASPKHYDEDMIRSPIFRNGELDIIRSRPALYFGSKDYPFTGLVAFLAGYAMGHTHGKHGTKTRTPEDFVPADFHRFVTEHFGQTFCRGCEGWHTLISEHTTSQQEAFEMFFRLLEEYEKTHTNAA
jgi:hypothetical protein